METLKTEGERPRLDPDDFAARSRAAVETFARNEAVLRRAAARYSLCADDADDALQRGLEILLRKAPTDDPRELVKWTQTVVKREALAIRRERERILPRPAPGVAAEEAPDWVELLPATSEGPSEAVERREAVARSREALQALKPQELRALTLLAEGYSYAEIGEITSWSRTKVNRCLAEGRERFRSLIARGEDGRRCAEMRPVISAFCDGEAEPQQVAELREHLRACGNCRATLRTYRAAPVAAAALLPALPLQRSLLERAREAFTDLVARSGGERSEAVTHLASGGGAGGFGVAAVAKVAAVCIGAAGGAAACVATGLVPGLPQAGVPPQPVHQLHRVAPTLEREPVIEYEPAPAADPSPPQPHPKQQPQPAPEEPEAAPVAAEPAPVLPEPVSGEAIESQPPPAPEPAPEPVAAPTPEAGSPAGEFGP